MDALGRFVDRVVEAVAPRAAVARREARELLAGKQGLVGRGYAAASVDLATGGWSPGEKSLPEILRSDAVLLRSRARALTRDNPQVSRAVQTLVDLAVGDGHEYQARVEEDGDLVEPVNRALGECWARWCEEADYSGRLHFGEIQALCKREEVEAGEWLLVRHIVDDPARYLPIAYQVLEAERLATSGAVPLQGNELDQGVEFDPRTGRVAAYHFRREGPGRGSMRPLRVASRFVLHGFAAIRAPQFHGVTALAQGVLLADMLHDLLMSELNGSRLASKWLAWVKTADPVGFQAGSVASRRPATQYGKIEEFASGFREFLFPNEEVTLAKSDRPGDNFAPFVSLMVRSLAVSLGVPAEVLLGDYSGLNYTTLRGARIDLAHALRPHQSRHRRQLLEPVLRDVLGFAALTRRVRELAGYWADPRRYQRAEWAPPGLEPLDPLREGRAAADAVASRLASPQEWIRRRGRDPERVLQEVAAYRKRSAELGLVDEPAAPAEGVVTNPARFVEAEDEDDEEGGGEPEGRGARAAAAPVVAPAEIRIELAQPAARRVQKRARRDVDGSWTIEEVA